ncbi:MAG TPA: class I SAM-dependent methyltransferase [Gemmatimonadales bacterium]|jgi:SAM-dependent methyltransferase
MADPRPDYGIDAPGVIRNLAVAGGILLVVAIAATLGLIPAQAPLWGGGEGAGVQLAIAPSAFPAGFSLCAAACWMYFGSRFGKIAEREKLVSRLAWRGDERVLDIGCGRGLMLVGAARRLTTGTAVGIDIWNAEDLSGNTAEVPLRNAEIEGVGARVSVETADMRHLPFPDASFDVVVSRAAIHNLYHDAERADAIAEIARILKPGGRALIWDIRHLDEYAREFETAGCSARLLESRLRSVMTALMTMGKMRPNTLLASRAA